MGWFTEFMEEIFLVIFFKTLEVIPYMEVFKSFLLFFSNGVAPQPTM